MRSAVRILDYGLMDPYDAIALDENRATIVQLKDGRFGFVPVIVGGVRGPALIGAQRTSTIGYNAASTTGTTLTSGVANTKGSWVQLSAGLATPSFAGVLRIKSTSAATSQAAIDIGLGAAAAEQILVPDLFCIGDSTAAINNIRQHYFLPIAFSGARIASRVACVAATQTYDVSMLIYHA